MRINQEKMKTVVGDVAVYCNEKGEVVHSATVTKVDEKGNPGSESGLGGTELAAHVDPAGKYIMAIADI